jgi:hypothetical protein
LLVPRTDGLLRGGVDDETQPWQSVQHTRNEGIMPLLDLLELRRTRGRTIGASVEARAHRLSLEAHGFNTRSLIHRSLRPVEMRMQAVAYNRRAGLYSSADDELPQPRAIDWLNGKPSPVSFRDEIPKSGRMLDTGKPDMDLILGTVRSDAHALETMRSGLPIRLQLTENTHPASQTKGRSGTIRGLWAEDGRTHLAPSARVRSAS